MMASRTCRLFVQGKCHYGKKCKFSHDDGASQSGDPPSKSRPPKKFDPGTQAAMDDLRRLKQLLFQKPSSQGRVASGVVVAFFQAARKLMDGDLGAAQETIKLLAQDDGLAFIRHLAKEIIPTSMTASRLQMNIVWRDQVKLFFETVTHDRMVDSSVLEQQRATIYNFMVGINGERAQTFFNFTQELVKNSSGLSQVDITKLSLALIFNMIDCNSNNIVAGVFNPIVQAYNDIFSSLSSTDEHDMLKMRFYLDYLNRRLDIGFQLPSQNFRTKDTMPKATFTIDQDLPGRLSKQGPRHNNDHADIADIQILPTYNEIMSPRAEYLPTTDTSLFHQPGIKGRLDREFRLLREDTVGQLRDAIRAYIDCIKMPQRKVRENTKDKSLRTYVYPDVTVADIQVDERQGLKILVRFAQPKMSGRQAKHREEWWKLSKRLQPGALVCIVSQKDAAIFAVVAEETRPRRDDQGKEKEKKSQPSLFGDANEAYVSLNLADESRSTLYECLRWSAGTRSKGYHASWSIVEFPGVLLPSFKHTLEALKSLYKNPKLPFSDILAPPPDSDSSTAGPGSTKVVEPPMYATKAGFQFDLSCLTSEPGKRLSTSLQHPLAPKELAESTSLDETQSSALLDALNRGMTLIQGPPGTGKSYTGERIIQVLLHNKKKAVLGPILCVCYTNHALDQLLEHLLDSGVKQIIRMGSGSKSERLKALNLRIVAGSEDRTKAERAALYDLYHSIEAHTEIINKTLADLDACEGHSSVSKYLLEHHPRHCAELFPAKVQEGEWEVMQGKPERVFKRWLNGGSSTSTTIRRTDQLKVLSLYSMSNAERRQLHHHWVQQMRQALYRVIVETYIDYLRDVEQKNKINKDVDLRCISKANIIGITTTGLARNLSLLQHLRSKVMLCEEAGEVLEAHTITALLPSVEHAILIGDHLQLRPQVANYELSSAHPRGAKHSLDVSLFERLVQPPIEGDLKVPFSTLQTQRRMHPSISQLIRSTLYPGLDDGGPVTQYPEVVGMKDRLFWFDHTNHEDGSAVNNAINTTRSNQFEVDMTIRLVQHLVRQGEYGMEDIAVLTPYVGQLQALRKSMRGIFEVAIDDRDLEDLEALETSQESPDGAHASTPPPDQIVKANILERVRVATVDNFQGEEAKVVVISLVRSNEEKRCGFLRTSNRINVLLSRAKHGMYIIGDSSTYESIPMWADVLTMLRRDGNFGEALHLQCPRHPDTPISVSCADHFLQFSPEGGCLLACERRLDCGHACINICHSEVLHKAVKCLEPCPRPRRDCNHACPLVCGERCPPKCQVILKDTTLTLACGHNFSKPQCWQSRAVSSIRCQEPVERTLQDCGHELILPCNVDIESKSFVCPTLCGAQLPCGHVCKKPCSTCRPKDKSGIVAEANHGRCPVRCGRNYTTCRHSCSRACHSESPCSPCEAPCDVRCSHSRCDKRCHEPCAPCAESQCASHCAHTQCSMPCAAPCDWVPCSKRCDLKLKCGHQCPSLCGEPCPNERFCQECSNDEVKGAVVDFIMGMTYREIDLNDDPCVFPDCGHFLTRSNMDGLMSLSDQYQLDTDGNAVALVGQSIPFSMDEVKTCPTCRGSLRNIARYGRIVRRALLDEITKKSILWSNGRCIELGQRLVGSTVNLKKASKPRTFQVASHAAKGEMSLNSVSQLRQLNNVLGGGLYSELISLLQDINKFRSVVELEEQPLRKVDDFVRFANNQRSLDFDESRLHMKGSLQAALLAFKCQLVILLSFFDLRKDHAYLRSLRVAELKQQLGECSSLIAVARSRGLPREELEGHLCYAKFCIINRASASVSEGESNDKSGDVAAWTEKASEHVERAKELLERHSSTVSMLLPEVDATSLMLTNGTFYTEVSKDEMRAVYAAMAREFRGTGHWYTCVKGHPFTVGECGMPMEEAKCPECGEGVGGRSHVPTAGVQRATEMDEFARDIGRMEM